MKDHRFLVGQQALLDHNALTRTTSTVEVLRQLPSDVDGSPQYRVRAGCEGFERLVKEHQLSVVTVSPGGTVFS